MWCLTWTQIKSRSPAKFNAFGLGYSPIALHRNSKGGLYYGRRTKVTWKFIYSGLWRQGIHPIYGLIKFILDSCNMMKKEPEIYKNKKINEWLHPITSTRIPIHQLYIYIWMNIKPQLFASLGGWFCTLLTPAVIVEAENLSRAFCRTL